MSCVKALLLLVLVLLMWFTVMCMSQVVILEHLPCASIIFGRFEHCEKSAVYTRVNRQRCRGRHVESSKNQKVVLPQHT